MNPFVSTERTITTLSIALATGAAKGIEALLPDGSHQGLSASVFVLGIPLITALIKSSTTKLFNKSRYLRRLVWGKHDIEGSWIDCMCCDSKIVTIGLTEFFVKDFVVHWRGQNFTPEGRETSAYEAVAVSVDWPITKFWYATHPSEQRSKQDEGICELTFIAPNGKTPRVYFGWACDTGSSKVVSLRGKRVDDTAILDKLAEIDSMIPTLLEVTAALRTLPLPDHPRTKEREQP